MTMTAKVFWFFAICAVIKIATAPTAPAVEKIDCGNAATKALMAAVIAERDGVRISSAEYGIRQHCK